LDKLSPAIITSAKLNPSITNLLHKEEKLNSYWLGWQDKAGTVEAGKLANVIVVAPEPLADIRSLENMDNIKLVLKDGRIVKDMRS
jgi:hypothetical protein